MAGIGSWESLPPSGKLRWSQNLYRLFGLEPNEVVPTLEFVLDQTHPDDRDRLSRYVEMSRKTPNPPPIEYRISQPGRGIRYLRSTITTTDYTESGAARIVGAVQDVTEQRLLTREVAAHIAVSRAIRGWDQFEPSGRRLLSELGGAVEAAAGALWIPEGDVLRARLVWAAPSLGDMSEFERATVGLTLREGTGPLREVWRRQRVIAVADVGRHRHYRRVAVAARAQLRGVIAFPAVHRGEVVAVLEFYYPDEFRPDDLFRQTLVAIGYELGQFLSRRLGELRMQPLTSRELQVLRLSAEGYSGPRIADALSIKPTTVATHLKHAYEKLGVADRASAVATLMRLGVLE